MDFKDGITNWVGREGEEGHWGSGRCRVLLFYRFINWLNLGVNHKSLLGVLVVG